MNNNMEINYIFNLLLISIKNNNVEDLNTWYNLIDDVNLCDPESGNSLLHYAFFFSSFNCVKMLLDNNADYLIKNKKNETPIDFFYHVCHRDINNKKYKKIFSLLKDKISERKMENIIANNIFKLLNTEEYKNIEFLIKLIDLDKTNGVKYYSEKNKRIDFQHFAFLAYYTNNYEFFRLIKQNNIRITQNELEDIKKYALIENKSEWISLLNNDVFYTCNSYEVALAVDEILAF